MNRVSDLNIHAILFDLDGTLLDTIPDLIAAAKRMLETLRRPSRSDSEIKSFVGKGIPHLVKRLMGFDHDAPETETARALDLFRDYYSQENGVRSRPFPNVRETLNVLKKQGYRLAVVTNKAENFTLPLLEQQDFLKFFDAVVSGDTLPVKKPDPRPLLHACETLHIMPAHTLFIGDSMNDSEAARAAEIPVLLLTYGYNGGRPVESLDCDGLLPDFAHILDWLKQTQSCPCR